MSIILFTSYTNPILDGTECMHVWFLIAYYIKASYLQ